MIDHHVCSRKSSCYQRNDLANLFALHFTSVYYDTSCTIHALNYSTTIDLNNCQTSLINSLSIPQRIFLAKQVQVLMVCLKFYWENVHLLYLSQLVRFITYHYHLRISWKVYYISPNFKSGNQSNVENCIFISILSHIPKIFYSFDSTTLLLIRFTILSHRLK